MREITNRDELLTALNRLGNGGRTADEYELFSARFDHLLDWLSEQGLALVNAEPTEAAIFAALEPNSDWIRGIAWAHMGVWIKAANKTGDLLKKEKV